MAASTAGAGNRILNGEFFPSEFPCKPGNGVGSIVQKKVAIVKVFKHAFMHRVFSGWYIPGRNGSCNVPMRGAKGTLYEGGIRVPMFAYWKGKILPRQVIDEMVTTLDFSATAIAVGGGEIPSEFDGVNILPRLTGKAAKIVHTKPMFWNFYTGQAVRNSVHRPMLNPIRAISFLTIIRSQNHIHYRLFRPANNRKTREKLRLLVPRNHSVRWVRFQSKRRLRRVEW